MSLQVVEAEAEAASIACAVEEQALLNERGEAVADGLGSEVLALTALVAKNGAALDAQVCVAAASGPATPAAAHLAHPATARRLLSCMHRLSSAGSSTSLSRRPPGVPKQPGRPPTLLVRAGEGGGEWCGGYEASPPLPSAAAAAVLAASQSRAPASPRAAAGGANGAGGVPKLPFALFAQAAGGDGDTDAFTADPDPARARRMRAHAIALADLKRHAEGLSEEISGACAWGRVKDKRAVMRQTHTMPPSYRPQGTARRSSRLSAF